MSEVDVFHLLNTLKLSKACGHDKIPPKLLRDSAIVIAPILSHIFNQSINTGIFPKDLKTAVISPLYKVEVRQNVATIDLSLFFQQLPKFLRN